MRIPKKILTICMIFLIFGANLLPLISSESIDVKKRVVNTDNKAIICIHASSPYDYGLKAGIKHSMQRKGD